MGIDGSWRGHYVQRFQSEDADDRFPIEACFEVKDSVLTGTMTDLRRDHITLLSDEIRPALPQLRLSLRIYWSLTLLFHPRAALRSELPEKSMLDGQVDGDTVTFTKRYLGQTQVVCDYGWTKKTYSQACEELTYKGRIEEGGLLIRGTYGFPQCADQPGDAFELRLLSGH